MPLSDHIRHRSVQVPFPDCVFLDPIEQNCVVAPWQFCNNLLQNLGIGPGLR